MNEKLLIQRLLLPSQFPFSFSFGPALFTLFFFDHTFLLFDRHFRYFVFHILLHFIIKAHTGFDTSKQGVPYAFEERKVLRTLINDVERSWYSARIVGIIVF